MDRPQLDFFMSAFRNRQSSHGVHTLQTAGQARKVPAASYR